MALKIRIPLAPKIAILIMAVFVIAAALLSSYSYQTEKRVLMELLKSKASSIAEELVLSFGPLLERQDIEDLQHLIMSTAIIHGIRRISVVGKDLLVTADSKPRHLGMPTDQIRLLEAFKEEEPTSFIYTSEGEKVYRLTYPLIKGMPGKKGDVIGAVLLEMDVSKAEALAREHLISIITRFIPGAILIALILFFILKRTVVNPILSLTDATKSMAEGKFDTRVNIREGDEIGDLAASFNKMTLDLKTSRDELITAKDYTDNIIKSMIDTLLVVDPDGKIKTINKATSDLLGYKEDELIGKPVATIFAEEEEEEEEKTPFKGTKMKKLIEEGSIRDYDMTYKTKTGERIPVSFSGSVMRDKEGELIGIVGIARDMREIKRLMQKEKELAAAAAAAAETEKKRAVELEKAYKELKEKSERLERFHSVAVDQELEMVRLEEEVNTLLQNLGQPKKYETPEKIQKRKEVI